MKTVNLLDRQSDAAILLFKSVVALEADSSAAGEIGKQYPGGRDVPVVCTIGDIEVDIIATLAVAWGQIESEIDEIAGKRALEMVMAAGLEDMQKLSEDMREMTREFRWKVIDKFRDAGIMINTDEDN